MEKLIKQKLKEIEKEHNVTIIYAVESGSRAWGFSSGNSDWDVRFIYVPKSDSYCRVFPGRDVIEIMDKDNDLDFAGWDLKKALALLNKGNPPLLEWLDSPMVYQEHKEATQELRSLSKGFYDSKSAIYHYIHMTENNYRVYIKDRDQVRVKKYLYVIRPLLACMWIEYNGTMPPMEMDKTRLLLDVRSDTVAMEVEKLVNAKKAGDELGTGKCNPVLNDFIKYKLDYYNKYVLSLKNTAKDHEALNQYAIKWIKALDD